MEEDYYWGPRGEEHDSDDEQERERVRERHKWS